MKIWLGIIGAAIVLVGALLVFGHMCWLMWHDNDDTGCQ